MNPKQLATVLAALRFWQDNTGVENGFAGHFEDHDPLTDEEINALCEDLNCSCTITMDKEYWEQTLAALETRQSYAREHGRLGIATRSVTAFNTITTQLGD